MVSASDAMKLVTTSCKLADVTVNGSERPEDLNQFGQTAAFTSLVTATSRTILSHLPEGGREAALSLELVQSSFSPGSTGNVLVEVWHESAQP